jgi:hypothetical protein
MTGNSKSRLTGRTLVVSNHYAKEGRGMTKKNLLIDTILSAALFCSSVTLAQTPVQNIDKNYHPNLAEAQNLIAQANKLPS